MRASIVIACHNEGNLIAKTLRSCLESTPDLDYEVIVVDDASQDGSMEEVRRSFPEARIVTHPKRRGCSWAKDSGARAARGETLVFLDGHSKPEKWAVVRLVNDVEECLGRALIVPRIAALDAERWENSAKLQGFGYQMSLLTFRTGWVPLRRLRARGRYLESPSLVGCCLAVSRDLYLKLRGFDRHMLEWGIEDVDLGLKAWLMGYAVLNDPYAVVGHRFRTGFTNFPVAAESVLANQIRCARKHLAEGPWREWLRAFRARHRRRWQAAWALFEKRRPSAERERAYLLASREVDEFWYARRFGLRWPRRARGRGSGRR